MRAARFYGKEDIRVEEIEEPVCKAGQVKVKPAFVGICGTDLHEYLGGPNFSPVTPHKVTGATIPITFGHEFSGVISEVGEGVKGFKVGQNVAVQPTIYDGTCAACHRGLVNVCDNGGFIGLSGWGGGLSDAVTVPADYILPLPDNVPLDIGALVEPLAVGWHAVSLAPLRKDSTILILGGGPIGISVINALRARGCGQIIVSELSSQRAKLAKHFSADHLLDPRKDDVAKRVLELTNGEGVDLVFDCAGVASALAPAFSATKVHGTVINVAIWEKAVPFNPNNMVFREAHYLASLGYLKKDFQEVIQAISSGAMTKPADMITKKIALERIVEDGIKELINNKENHVKILVQI